MRIEYQTTIEEMVTTQMLLLRGTKTFEIEVATCVFLWILICALVIYFCTGPLVNKFLFGFIFGGLICASPIIHTKTRIRKRLRKFIIRKMGSSTPFPASFYLSDEKIEYSSDHVSITFLLKDLKKVEDVEYGIFLDFIKGNVVYIPDSAFTNDSEKMQWKAKLNEICCGNL